ncbi:MAG: hypothetical protein LYZ69_03360 [Nitrososphaerales archaeon]|nr:hypothetical protein [Nitrososphaerales archaeon]
MANGPQNGSPDALSILFAVDSETSKPLPYELEVLVAWLSIVKKLPPPPPNRTYTEGIGAIAKVYYPLWAVNLGGKVAVLDPLADRVSRVEYREPTRIDGFVERLQETHRKVSMFRNMLEAYQNAFPMSGGTRSVDVPGLLSGSEAAAIMLRATRSDSNGGESANLPVVGGATFLAVKGTVTAIQTVFRSFAEGLEELRLAKSVLKVETESQLKSLGTEVGTLQAEYSKEIEATRDLADRTVEALVKKRDEEIEMVASRFTEIREMLVSDLMNLKKAHSAILREEGYLRRVAAASVASRLTPGSDMVKLLLGDHASRLRTVKDEASKVQVLVEEIEKEKGRELSAIKDLYDELIRAKSRVISDLQIELEVEVEKRTAEISELRELQESIEKKLDNVVASNEQYLHNLDWIVQDSAGVKENTPVYVPIYLAMPERSEGPFLACPPSLFLSGSPPLGAAYSLEERLKPLSGYLRALTDLQIPHKALKERDFNRKLAQLVRGHDLMPSLTETVATGLKLAQERGWIGEPRARAIEALAAKLSA